MSEHRYILEPYKGMNTRYHCPTCQQRDKTFSLYIDTETGEHLHPTVGRCNRESNCGHHYTPKQYFADTGSFLDLYTRTRAERSVFIPTQKTISFIPVEVFKASLNPKAFEANHFLKFLINLFGVEVASGLVSRYFIGTSKYQFTNKDFPNYKSERGANVFWQIDTNGKVRTGKIMLYSPTTGKRVKEPFNHINWAHSLLKMPEFELKQCLFGEHLLIDKTKPVAIVESEKTAIISSVYFPQFVWVAVGSLNNLNAEKCSILKGRTVTLFPDLNGFEKWGSKAKELSHIAKFTVSDLLERKATETERQQGFDLADYLVKFNFKEFAPPEPHKPNEQQQFSACTTPENSEPNEQQEGFSQITTRAHKQVKEVAVSESWEQEISELENYFAGIELPTQPVKLNSYSTITDCSQFIETHLTTVKANNGKHNFLPYLNRLQELKEVLSLNLL
jgi:hypothetical protein